MQKRSNDRANEETKNIRISENNRNKKLSDIKGIMPIQYNKLLDECKNNGVNITNKETGRNGKQP